MKRLIIFVMLCVLLAATVGTMAATAQLVTATSTAQFRYNARHTGDYSLVAGLPSNGVLKWKFTSGGDVQSSPTVSSGVVYVGSRDYNFYALNGR